MNKLARLVYGCTLADGGCTLPLWKGDFLDEINPTFGYVVGGLVKEVSCNPMDYKEFESTFEDFMNYAMCSNSLPDYIGIGTWIENGECVFDIIQIIPDKETAWSVAVGRGERAFWDCEDTKTIMVKA